MSDKLPSLQFYPGDWKKDPGVQALSFHDRGVWFEILLLMHESERRGVLLLNGGAMPDEALAQILGLDKQILTTTISTLLTYGVASREEGTNALLCRRMVRDEELRQMKIRAGKLGGNPVLLKQTSKQTTTTGVKQNGGSSYSVSVSSSDNNTTVDAPFLVDGSEPTLFGSDVVDCAPHQKRSKKTAKTYSPVVEDLAAKLIARHPRCRTCSPSQAKELIASIFRFHPERKPDELSEQIDRNHAVACATDQWTRDGGQYAKGLDNWLAPTVGRYLVEMENVPIAVAHTKRSAFMEALDSL